MTNLTVSKTELIKALDVCITNSSTSAYLIEGISPVQFISDDCGSWINMYSGFTNDSEASDVENDMKYNEYVNEVQDFIKSNLLDEVEGNQVTYID